MSQLTLKWGTLKGWDFKGNEKAIKLLEEYHEIGASWSCATQKDTSRQKEIIIELIDIAKGKIYLDWDGKLVSKKKAKDYILNYGDSK